MIASTDGPLTTLTGYRSLTASVNYVIVNNMRVAVLACIFFTPSILGAAEPSTPTPVVRSIGVHQYVITDAGKHVFAEASATCAQEGRTAIPLAVPPEEAEIPFEKRFKFECILAYEIVPSGQGTYTIHVPSDKMLAPIDRVCPPATCPLKVPLTQLPDIGTASEQTRQLAHTFCAKMHQSMVVTGVGFDMGPGLTFIFKCVPPQPEAPSR